MVFPGGRDLIIPRFTKFSLSLYIFRKKWRKDLIYNNVGNGYFKNCRVNLNLSINFRVNLFYKRTLMVLILSNLNHISKKQKFYPIYFVVFRFFSQNFNALKILMFFLFFSLQSINLSLLNIQSSIFL